MTTAWMPDVPSGNTPPSTPSAGCWAAPFPSVARANSTCRPGGGAAHSQPQVYNRGDHTFNRRFFESKFPGFFRVVAGEAEKDLVLVFKCVKNEYIGKRISRISSNELHLQLLNSTTEVSIAFNDVTTVIVRHKDAKP